MRDLKKGTYFDGISHSMDNEIQQKTGRDDAFEREIALYITDNNIEKALGFLNTLKK